MENSKVSDEETMSLVIKTPNQFHGDQLIEGVRMDWTVKDLKCHLSKVYPNNPVGLDCFLYPIGVGLHLASRQHSSTDNRQLASMAEQCRKYLSVIYTINRR